MTGRAEEEAVALVGAVRADPSRRDELVSLLSERHPVHAGRSAAATARMRAWVLAACAEVGLPDGAVPFVREELGSGIEAAPVAAAARAARSRPPLPGLDAMLLAAFASLRTRDAPVSLASLHPRWPAPDATTALAEVVATARWLSGHDDAPALDREAWSGVDGPDLAPDVRLALRDLLDDAPGGHCCGAAPAASPSAVAPAVGVDLAALHDVVVEDHAGVRHPLPDLLLGRSTAVAFFYTRCDNPNKCSLTVTLLGHVQEELARRAVGDLGLLLLTYDPAYDTPARLSRYAAGRGLHLGGTTRAGRAVQGHDLLDAALTLQAGSAGGLVNRHAVELLLVDPVGTVAAAWSRTRWEPAEVTDRLVALTPAPR